MKLLVIGGYGTFGSRLVRLLSDLDLEIVVVGRSLAKAESFRDAYQGASTIIADAFPRRQVDLALRRHRPDVVVDASGPFQAYGDEPYVVIEACLAHGIHYVDLADDPDFIDGTAELAQRARSAGIVVAVGVSSLPALSGAVLRELAATGTVERVEGGIAPSPGNRVGESVIAAILAYAGSPLPVLTNGRTQPLTGLADARRHVIAPPGAVPLRSTLFSLVSVPDLSILPKRMRSLRSVWFGGGPRPEPLHRILILISRLRRALGLPAYAPFTRLFSAIQNALRIGERRGGMYVLASGTQNGVPFSRSWHLIAEGDDGPFIPAMAADALVRRFVSGKAPAPGAWIGSDVVTLAEYERSFAHFRISTGFRDASDRLLPLYPRILASAWKALPPTIRAIHESRDTRTWSGTADVLRGRGLLARIAAGIVGFPPAGEGVPVSVTLSPHGDGELWTRDFAGRRFSSIQTPGRGRLEHLVVERFGLASFALALEVRDGELHLVPRHWRLCGMPMPRWLLPTGATFESERDGAFRFDVDIALPIVGRIVAYRGTLQPERPQ